MTIHEAQPLVAQRHLCCLESFADIDNTLFKGTEDWFGDGLSWQWSYYAALLSSATRLATPFGGTREFGGYIVPLSSQARVDGALLRRIISLIGGGAKALTYFTFGPEYIFPGNCYSERKSLPEILAQQQQAHELIGAAEDVLWPGRRVGSKVAILAHRTANAWDPPGTAKVNYLFDRSTVCI